MMARELLERIAREAAAGIAALEDEHEGRLRAATFEVAEAAAELRELVTSW